MPQTQVIVSTYSRTRAENVDDIIDVLLDQTVPFDKIVLVDNSPPPGYRYFQGYKPKPEILDVWSFPDNGVGPPCRFAPALIDWRYKYTLFLDDDLMPGTQMHQHLLAAAESVHDRFATLGEIGRIYARNQQSYKYVRQDVVRDHGMCTPVHLTCRAHLVLTNRIYHAIELRNKLIERYGPPPEGADDWTRHDDILLCHGIHMYTGDYSYLTPIGEVEDLIRKQDLPEPDAMWHRTGHAASRQALLEMTNLMGWEPRTLNIH